MKLRIKGNSLRLRLSQTEVADFAKTGNVSNKISFGVSQKNVLTYSLNRSMKKTLFVTYSSGEISVFLPEPEVDNWTKTEQVEIAGDCEVGNGEILKVLVEKDFQCLKERLGEDESDNFPNPEMEDAKC